MSYLIITSLFFSPAFFPTSSTLEGEGYYHRIFVHQTGLTRDGKLLILDRENGSIDAYDVKGKLIQKTGRKGSGPGEFRSPSRLLVYKDWIYIYDRPFIHVFNHDFHFSRRVIIPSGFALFEPCDFGWVGVEGLYEFSREQPTTMVLFSDDLAQSRVLFEWPSEQERYPKPALNFEIHFYNPVEEYSKFILDEFRKNLIMHLAGTDYFMGIHLENGEMRFKLKIPGPLIPFDSAWGKKQVALMEQMAHAQGIRTKTEGWYPEYFPKIRSFWPLPGNRFGVRSFSLQDINDPQKANYLTYSFEGKPEPKRPWDDFFYRAIGIFGENFYLITWLNTDVWTVAILPTHKALAYLESNPLPSFEEKIATLLKEQP